MITTTALTKSYGNAPVVRDVSLHCEPGTITGFLGPNGAGKSTTLRMIVGLARPDHGTSTIDGRPFVELPNPTRVVGTLLDPSAMHAGTHRPRDPDDRRTNGRRVDRPRGAPAGPRRADRRGRPAGGRLLPRDAAAARDRADARRRAEGADPGRAGERTGPRGHRLDARAAARLRRPWRDGAAVQPPAPRGAGHRRPSRRHLPGRGRRVRSAGRAARQLQPAAAHARPGGPGTRAPRGPASTTGPARTRRSPWTSRTVASPPRWSPASRSSSRCCSPNCASPTRADSNSSSSHSPPQRRHHSQEAAA